jgi:hypothetical protein
LISFSFASRHSVLLMGAAIFAGQEEGLTRDDILDNITLYWLTRTGVSSARLYWENKLAFFAPKQVAIPVAVSVFPDDLCPARGAGPKRRIPSSSITTSSTKAGTLRPGSSRKPSYKRSAPGSGRFAEEGILDGYDDEDGVEMRALTLAATLACAIGAPADTFAEDITMVQQATPRMAQLAAADPDRPPRKGRPRRLLDL